MPKTVESPLANPVAAYSGFKVCMVGNFHLEMRQIQLQAETLARHLESEGGSVSRTSFKEPVFKRALDMAWTLWRERHRYSFVHIQSHSYLNFLYTVLAVVMAKLLSKKVICMYYGGAAKEFLNRFGWFVLPVLRRVNVLVVASGFLAGVFNSYGLKPIIIPHVLDLSSWRFRERRQAQPKLLWVRHFDPEYNPRMLIEAFRLIKRQAPDATLCVVGTGQLQSELQVAVKRHGLSGIRFMGRVDREKLVELFCESDIFLSTSNVDNQPVTILEAFASGVPVVTTNAGGIPYIVTDGQTGLLVDIGDHEAMAEKVLELIENPSLAHRLSVEGYREVEKYSWVCIREQWLNIYRSLAVDV